MNEISTFETITIDNKHYCTTDETLLILQSGRGKSAYRTRLIFIRDFAGRAVMQYNMLNVGNGYKKRLIMQTGDKKTVIARRIT